MEVLANALTGLGVMPQRNFLTVKDFETLFKEEKELIFDATEKRIQRPGDNGRQKETYSGKKKANTLKSMLVSTKDKAIKYLGYCCFGKKYGFSLLKNSFLQNCLGLKILTSKLIWAILGIVKEYRCKTISIPYKK